MKNLFIFVYNFFDENVLDYNKYTNIIDYYNLHYEILLLLYKIIIIIILLIKLLETKN
jgi:hypothetical protein